MMRMAATGGLMLLVVGCYPAQQAYDQNPTAFYDNTAAATPQGTQPSWQHYDHKPVWPPAEPAPTASTATPLFNNSPLSPYSASAKTPGVSGSTMVASTTTTARPPAVSTMPGASPFQQLPAASRAATVPPSSSGVQVARADLPSRDVPPAKPASLSSLSAPLEPPPLGAMPDSMPLAKDAANPTATGATPKKDDKVPTFLPVPLPNDNKSVVVIKETKPAATPVTAPAPLPAAERTGPERTVSWEPMHTSAKVATNRSTPAVRMVNNKRIQFNYKVEDVGPSGVGGIELWYTVDGHTWQKCDNVRQVGNACVAEVPEEGTYGFTLVARSGTGNAKEPPKSGELPQVWVEVDLSAPKVALTEVKPAAGTEPRLGIFWSAIDRNMARHPITLSFAESSAGPWTIIAANLENSGKYDWVLPPTLPAKMLVKVEACDLVGNVGSVYSKEPIAFDVSKPTASILDVESASK